MILENMIRKEVREMPPSGIRKYFDIVNEMDDVISLGVGEPDFVTPWNVREAGIYSLEQGDTHYSSNAGFIELREEISKYLYRKFDLKYNPKDEILVTVGGSEGIDIALRALTGPGDEVIIPEPSFVAYKGCTAFTGATSKVINLKAENDFKLTAKELEDAITEKTKVVIIPFPNNPTGAIMTKEELAPIVHVLKDKDVIIISDEIYAELTYGQNHCSIASLPGMRDRTIIINGFSKSFAMTGWRMGFATGPELIMQQILKIHQFAIMAAPTTSQYAAIEAMTNGEEDVQIMRNAYNQRRRFVLELFSEMGLKCFEPEGAFYMFPCIKEFGMTSDEFANRFLREEKEAIIPGTAFGDCGEGFLRVSYAYSIEELKEALGRLANFVERLRKEKNL